MISKFNKGDIFQIISPQSGENINKSAVMQISQVLRTL